MVDPLNNPGNDLGSPPQNPVPYQQDPFAGAQVQEGTGPARTQYNLGFGRKQPKQQQYLSDPFADVGTRPAIEYTRPDDAVLSDDLISRQVDSSGEPLQSETPYDYTNEYGGVAPVGGNVTDPITGEDLGESFVREVEGTPGSVSRVTVDAGLAGGFDSTPETFDRDNATQDVLNKIASGVDPEAAAWEAGFEAPVPENPSLLDRGIGLVQDNLINPRTTTLASGEQFTTSPGIAGSALPGGLGLVAGIGGAISAANLNRVHGRIEEDPNYGTYYERGSIPGVNTPIATHEGFIPGTRVVSGNTDLIPGLTGGDDGVIDATEVDAYAQAAQAAEAERLRQAEIERQVAEDRRLREAAQAAERARAEAERQRIAEEQTRREREAAEQARQEAERRENQRRANEELERQRQQDRDNERAQIQQGRAVTDSSGRAVRDSSGRIVTDRPSSSNDSGGGGGGDSCFSATAKFKMHNGTYKEIQDIKVGDHMYGGGRVYGVLQGDGALETWYIYNDVYVTGSHFVYEDRWMPVEDSKNAMVLWTGFDTWYCVLNENHRMVSAEGTWFTDFDAVDSVNVELEERLNAVQE